MWKEDPDLIFVWLGMGAAAMSAFLRRANAGIKDFFTINGFLYAVIDAAACSILTSGITLSLHEYAGCSLVYAIGIGTFVGMLGYKSIISVIQRFLLKKVGLGDNANK